MVRLLRHRQTKEPDSARLHLNRRATPRLHPPIGVSVEMRIFHRESEADEPTVEISLLGQKMKSRGGDRSLMQEKRGRLSGPLT